MRTVVNCLSLHYRTVSTVGQNTNSDLPSNNDWFSKHPSIRHSLLFQLKMLEGMSPMLTSLQTTRSNPGETIAPIEQINHERRETVDLLGTISVGNFHSDH